MGLTVGLLFHSRAIRGTHAEVCAELMTEIICYVLAHVSLVGSLSEYISSLCVLAAYLQSQGLHGHGLCLMPLLFVSLARPSPGRGSLKTKPW